MDSNFLLNPSGLHSVYYKSKEDDGLRTLQPEAYHPSQHGMHFLKFFFLKKKNSDFLIGV